MNKDCRLIIQKADSKLKTARIDLESGQYDDAVSRAYYAVFHALTACLLTIDKSFSSHSQVIGAFNKEFIKSGIFPAAFSKDIQILFDDRQSGDYDILRLIDKETAEADLSKALKIVNHIKEYLDNV